MSTDSKPPPSRRGGRAESRNVTHHASADASADTAVKEGNIQARAKQPQETFEVERELSSYLVSIDLIEQLESLFIELACEFETANAADLSGQFWVTVQDSQGSRGWRSIAAYGSNIFADDVIKVKVSYLSEDLQLSLAFAGSGAARPLIGVFVRATEAHHIGRRAFERIDGVLRTARTQNIYLHPPWYVKTAVILSIGPLSYHSYSVFSGGNGALGALELILALLLLSYAGASWALPCTQIESPRSRYVSRLAEFIFSVLLMGLVVSLLAYVLIG